MWYLKCDCLFFVLMCVWIVLFDEFECLMSNDEMGLGVVCFDVKFVRRIRYCIYVSFWFKDFFVSIFFDFVFMVIVKKYMLFVCKVRGVKMVVLYVMGLWLNICEVAYASLRKSVFGKMVFRAEVL